MNHRIVFNLSEAQYNHIYVRAKNANMSVNAFVKQLALCETDCVKLRREAASAMATIYSWSEELSDVEARDYMRKAGDLLWQSLK